jgi:hypothetical protein
MNEKKRRSDAMDTRRDPTRCSPRLRHMAAKKESAENIKIIMETSERSFFEIMNNQIKNSHSIKIAIDAIEKIVQDEEDAKRNARQVEQDVENEKTIEDEKTIEYGYRNIGKITAGQMYNKMGIVFALDKFILIDLLLETNANKGNKYFMIGFLQFIYELNLKDKSFTKEDESFNFAIKKNDTIDDFILMPDKNYEGFLQEVVEKELKKKIEEAEKQNMEK